MSAHNDPKDLFKTLESGLLAAISLGQYDLEGIAKDELKSRNINPDEALEEEIDRLAQLETSFTD